MDGRVGVLLVNLGTAGRHRLLVDAALSEGVPSDRREVPRAICGSILNGTILTTRPAKKGATTRISSGTERNEGPLHHPRPGRALLAERFDLRRRPPSSSIKRCATATSNAEFRGRLLERGCERASWWCRFYPRHAATTATVADAFDALV